METLTYVVNLDPCRLLFLIKYYYVRMIYVTNIMYKISWYAHSHSHSTGYT